MARLASALTLDEAASITGMSRAAYQRAEEHPLELTLGELKALYSEMNQDGQSIMFTWAKALFGLT